MNCAIMLGFVCGYGLLKLRSIVNAVVFFAVSGANSLVESQLCDIAFPKGFLGCFQPAFYGVASSKWFQ